MALRLLLLSILALTLAGAASALTIQYTNYADFESTGSDTITITQFNPAWGYLTGVTVSVYQTSAASFQVDNDDVADRTAQAQMFRQWSVAGGTISDAFSGTFTSSTVSLSADNGDGAALADYTAPDGFNWGMVTGGGLHNTFNIASGNWGAYTGVGNVSYGVDMLGLLNGINTNSNSYQSQVINGVPANQRISIVVDYDYSEEVPEPGTITLISLGIVGLGAWRRRRQKVA